MGLLDQVLGSVSNNGTAAQQQPNNGQQGGLGGLLGGGGGGLAGIIGLIASNPQLLQMLLGMLSNRSGGGGDQAGQSAGGELGGFGGLGGLMAQFEQAGLGGAMQSWIGSGPNQDVSGPQISQALGGSTLASMAAQLGMPADEVASQLSQLLPGVVNHLTPDGQVPQDGLGDSNDMMARLGAALGPR